VKQVTAALLAALTSGQIAAAAAFRVAQPCPINAILDARPAGLVLQTDPTDSEVAPFPGGASKIAEKLLRFLAYREVTCL
jgi:hypothetical protein